MIFMIFEGDIFFFLVGFLLEKKLIEGLPLDVKRIKKKHDISFFEFLQAAGTKDKECTEILLRVFFFFFYLFD